MRQIEKSSKSIQITLHFVLFSLFTNYKIAMLFLSVTDYISVVMWSDSNSTQSEQN